MADEPNDRENAVNEPPQDSTVNEEQREVREPAEERWWENPHGSGEVH